MSMGDSQPAVADGLRLRRTLEWREVEGEIVALDLDKSVYLAANASGAVMWRMLSEGTTREALVEALVANYGIEVAAAQGDVDTFIGELDAQDCLERTAAG
jgi:hypothetical protein